MDLNSPATRQALLRKRLAQGDALAALPLAREPEVSPDTLRRDLIALEQAGLVHRLSGGAVPVARPARPSHPCTRRD